MIKSKFDPNAAFRNIVGVAEAARKEDYEMDSPDLEAREDMPAEMAFIVGNKGKEETRNKRVNLVLKPSVYSMAKAKCESLDISLNECVNQFLEKWSKE